MTHRRRLGLFGGTFDPPHHGHLIVASVVHQALGLEKLVFIPAKDPPHKPAVATPPDLRLAMVRAAIEGDPRFEVDDLELRRDGVSYTVDTLREYRSRFADAELVFLLGIDQFRALSSWREPDEVARLATLAVVEREGETLRPTGPYQAVEVPIPRIDVSSTEIRERAREGRSIRYYVPERVREIVEREGLYQTARSEL